MIAALFTGAVAAHSGEVYSGDIYIYGLYDKVNNTVPLSSTSWVSSADGKTTLTANYDAAATGTGKYWFSATAEQAGQYYCDYNGLRYYINLKFPSAGITGTVAKNVSGIWTNVASLIGGSADLKDNVTIKALEIGHGSVNGMVFTHPNGIPQTINITGMTPNSAMSTPTSLTYDNLTGMDVGTWTVQSYILPDGKNYTKLAGSMILGQEYTFDVIDADTSKTLTASTDSVTQGQYVTINVEAPYGYWKVDVNDAGLIIKDQKNVYADKEETPMPADSTTAYVKVETSGKESFVVKSKTTDDLKVSLYDQDDKLIKKITIKVTAGAITVTTDATTVYIGDEFDVEGTNDLGGTLNFYIKGTNYDVTPLKSKSTGNLVTASGSVWSKTIDTEDFSASNKKPDAATYTIYVAKIKSGINASTYIKTTSDFDNESRVEAYTVFSIALIQPFITIEVPEVVIQGEKLEIKGSAEGSPAIVNIYVFGTNFFKAANASVISEDASYSFSKKIVDTDADESTDNWRMDTGQYYVVVQHPMYDKVFNIAADDSEYGANIRLNSSAGWSNGIADSNGEILFNTKEKQSSNAAYALEQDIASQDIDDMQAHKSFLVSTSESKVNPIPSQVTKGQKLTISGTTTGHKNDMATVELLSTAFAAVPKETVGSAAFATLSTRIGEDGTWSVTFDTSSLNADDYTVSIAVGSLGKVTGYTKIVAGSGSGTVTPTTTPTVAPTVKPTTVQPTTTPKTPGFGALAALAGLGAVAVLLLRRE